MKIINWAPGAVQTEMTDYIRASKDLEPNVATWYKEAHEKGDLLSPEKSSNKLAQLVLSGNFESGAHIDYWDVGDVAKQENESIATTKSN